jgi:ADP-ribosylglycohydrolase
MYGFTFDTAYGALVGAAVGDAAGATLEFYNGQEITTQIAEHAMTMPGGGALGVAPGQITDDTELALSLARVLATSNPKDKFPIDKIALSYIEWYKSRPFDIGNTCATAFACSDTFNGVGSIAQHMINTSYHKNSLSEANGALMRVTPIAVWLSQCSQKQLLTCAALDAQLSHPNPICQEANIIYVMIVAHLINNPGDAGGAIKIAEDFVRKTPVQQRINDWVLRDSKLKYEHICKDVKTNIGWVKHGFTLALHFLRNKTPFHEAIKKTLMCGGDTDTNACIVGGVMGAYWGESHIPSSMKVPVLTFQCDKVNTHTKKLAQGYKRPAKYRLTDLKDITSGLLGLECFITLL